MAESLVTGAPALIGDGLNGCSIPPYRIIGPITPFIELWDSKTVIRQRSIVSCISLGGSITAIHSHFPSVATIILFLYSEAHVIQKGNQLETNYVRNSHGRVNSNSVVDDAMPSRILFLANAWHAEKLQ